MAFSADLLNPEEELVLDLRPHWWFIVPASSLLAIAVLIGVIIAVQDIDGALGTVLGVFWGLVVLASLGFFAARYAKWLTTDFVVTSDRIIYRSGVFAKSGTEIPVDKVNAVHFSQTVFERILGLGTLRVESASETGASEFEDIRKPSMVQNIINQQSENAERRDRESLAAAVSGQHSAPATLSIPQQIQQYEELRQSGAITDAEYEAKKAQLLGGSQ